MPRLHSYHRQTMIDLIDSQEIPKKQKNLIIAKSTISEITSNHILNEGAYIHVTDEVYLGILKVVA